MIEEYEAGVNGGTKLWWTKLMVCGKSLCGKSLCGKNIPAKQKAIFYNRHVRPIILYESMKKVRMDLLVNKSMVRVTCGVHS